MKNLDQMTNQEIIAKYEEIKEKIRVLQEQLKIYKKRVYDITYESDNETLETLNSIFKIYYKPKWKFTDELTKQESEYKEEIKILKLEEKHSGLAKKLKAGGYLVMKPRKKLKL